VNKVKRQPVAEAAYLKPGTIKVAKMNVQDHFATSLPTYEEENQFRNVPVLKKPRQDVFFRSSKDV
jgi:hypothetical protein